MIKKNLTLMLFLCGVLAVVNLTSCERPAEDGDDDDMEQVDTTDVGSGETTFQEEDRSKRPSPPDSAVAIVGNTRIAIHFGSPRVKGRKVWGDLVPHGKIWRTGANEATTFEVTNDVMINDQQLPAGKYGLFTIPGQNEWTVVFNRTWDQWGAFDYDTAQDVLRVKVDAERSEQLQEEMDFRIEQEGNTATVRFFWENVTWSFDVEPVQ